MTVMTSLSACPRVLARRTAELVSALAAKDEDDGSSYDPRVTTLHVTEAELARDLHPVLAKLRQGIEVVIEQDSHPIAVLKAPQVKGRRISEVIDALEASGANAVIDEDFKRDVEAAINAHREPWNPPSWE